MLHMHFTSDKIGVFRLFIVFTLSCLLLRSNEKEKVKMLMPRPDSDVYNQFKYRCRGEAF